MSLDKLFILLILFFMGQDSKGQDPEDNVFKVTLGCGKGCKQKIQTGFRLSGYKGIVTTLHGMTAATAITAENKRNNYYDLRIVRVDMVRDIAIVSNDQLERASGAEGLALSPSTSFPSNVNYKSYGHPYGVQIVPRDDIKLANPSRIILSQRIPGPEQALYANRNSPSPSIGVIEIRYDFGNGESGAPILNQQNQVIGMLDGGFDYINISWAIPVNEVRFSSNISTSAISHLNEYPIQLTHCYQVDVEEIAGKKVSDISDLIQDWYFALRKMSIAYALATDKQNFSALKYFDPSTLSTRMKNALDVSCDQYAYFNSPFYDLLYSEVNNATPIDFIPVNIEKKPNNKSEYTIYLRYNSPLYGYKQSDDINTLHASFDFDFLQQELKYKHIKELKKLNVQVTFILDNNFNLVDVKNIKLVFPDESFFQCK
jgi:Trypsin-like peptidase domain